MLYEQIKMIGLILISFIAISVNCYREDELFNDESALYKQARANG